MLRVWELVPNANRFLAVQTVDLRYFSDHFIGRPMERDWIVPPYEILNRSKKVGDFTSWQIGNVVLVSARARDAIGALCKDDVEFLPFGLLKRTEMYALNVLRVEDYLDADASEFLSVGVPAKARFKRLPTDLPPVFKVHGSSFIYASAALGRLVVAENFTGALLADPGKNRLQQIVHREINEFPGIRLG